MRILFLDFDGVLHPDQVSNDRRLGVILRCDGHNLFEHSELLVTMLRPHPEVKIVLSTSWVKVLGFNQAKDRLPRELQERIVGATYSESMAEYFSGLSRYEQIIDHVVENGLTDWIAVDDDGTGWPEDQSHRLVMTDEWIGIGDSAAQEKLREWMKDSAIHESVSPVIDLKGMVNKPDKPVSVEDMNIMSTKPK